MAIYICYASHNIYIYIYSAWFLKIGPVWIVGMRVCVCVCVCPHPRLLMTSGVMWHDMELIQLFIQVLKLLYSNCSRYC